MSRRIPVLLALVAAVILAMFLWPRTPQPQPMLVLAASSLQEAMTEAADAWEKQGHPKPSISFAASSALARQAAAGAAADLFVSADVAWMDDLDRRGLLAPGTRRDFLGNELVLIAADHVTVPRGLAPGPGLATAFGRARIAMADPDSVPAGRYGKAALEHYSAWNALAGQVTRTENVRAALALVERGAAWWGIVYATDARASGKVRTVFAFPPESHAPIRYPLARLKASTAPDAEPFRQFLLSPAGKAIFARHGFAPL